MPIRPASTSRRDTNPIISPTPLLDLSPSVSRFLRDVLEGMRSTPKSLPCKYFYDDVGSQLFDEICELEEYYLTRTELAIMQRHAEEMADQIGPGVMLVEYGSGSSLKTRILLDHLVDPVAYVPVDISRSHLQAAAQRISRAYPRLEVLPVCADFTENFVLPQSRRTPTHSAVFFPGSTIGNFAPQSAHAILGRIAPLCGAGGGLLIGVDLEKDRRPLEAAYNDAAGVTARFNLNLLERINRELHGDFDVSRFSHSAVYQETFKRVEMSLVSLCDQSVAIGPQEFQLKAGEAISTEYSHKYTIARFAAMASAVDLELHRSWTDPEEQFGVLHLAVHKA